MGISAPALTEQILSRYNSELLWIAFTIRRRNPITDAVTTVNRFINECATARDISEELSVPAPTVLATFRKRQIEEAIHQIRSAVTTFLVRVVLDDVEHGLFSLNWGASLA